MRSKLHILRSLAAVALAAGPSALGQMPLGTGFTYQGQLKSGGSPASGNFNMVFKLWNDPTLSAPANQIGPTLLFDGVDGNPSPVTIANGLFTVLLDFGSTAYNGDKRWLEITVSDTTLAPRQELTAAPYARFSAAPWATTGIDISNTNTGNVGIGTATPTDHKLEIVDESASSQLSRLLKLASRSTHAEGDARLSFSLRNGTGTDQVGEIIAVKDINNDGVGYLIRTNNNGAAVNAMMIDKTGNVGIGITWPSQKLHVIGNICATGTIGACSDARFKKNVEPIRGALEAVEKLQGVHFDWKRDEYRDHEFSDQRQVGFIAQDVEKVLPEIVSKGSDGSLSVDYGRLTPVIIEAVKELKRENAILKERLHKLESALDNLASGKTAGVR